MKSIIAAVLVMFSFSSFAASYDIKEDVSNPAMEDVIGDRCAPGDILYYGQNAKHTKEVLICQWDSTVFYDFGKIGVRSADGRLVHEMSLKASNKQFKAEVSDGNNWSLENMVIPNGDVVYVVGHTADFIKGTDVDQIRVYKKTNMGQPIAVIELDQNTVVNNIRNNFVE